MAQRVMAIEIAGNSVRGAFAERTWSSFAMLGTVEDRQTEGEDDLAPALRRLYDAAGKPPLVISAMPAAAVVKRLLALPFSDRRRLARVVPFALEEHLPLAVDDAVVAFSRVGTEDGKTLVMAALARPDDLRRHLELLARAGIDPRTVTLSALALANLLSHMSNGHAGAHLLVELDYACASMVLLDATGIPRAFRSVDAAVGDAHASPGGRTVLGAMRQTLLAYGSGNDRPALVLTGPAAAPPEVRRRIAEALDVTVLTLDEFDCASVFGPLAPRSMRFAGCLAMLAAEAPGRPADLLDLRQGEFAFHGHVGDLAPLRTTIWLVCAVLLAASLHFGVGLSTKLHRLRGVHHQLAAIAYPALGRGYRGDVLGALDERITATQRELRNLGVAGVGAQPLDVLLAVSQALPSRLGAIVEDFNFDDDALKLDGTADSYADIDRVKHALDQSGYFTNIQVTHAAAEADPNKVEFRVTATVRGAPGA